jgi:hypothetical protein
MKDKKNYEIKYCLFCNRPFVVLKTRMKQSKKGGFYCSYQCQALGNFKRNKFVGKNGYVIIPIIKNGKIIQCYEHREIMQSWLKIILSSNKTIHHIDGNKTNNSLSNLEIMPRGEHIRLHLKKYGKVKCLVQNCNSLAIKKNLCNKHYLKEWKLNKYARLEAQK